MYVMVIRKKEERFSVYLMKEIGENLAFVITINSNDLRPASSAAISQLKVDIIAFHPRQINSIRFNMALIRLADISSCCFFFSNINPLDVKVIIESVVSAAL